MIGKCGTSGGNSDKTRQKKREIKTREKTRVFSRTFLDFKRVLFGIGWEKNLQDPTREKNRGIPNDYFYWNLLGQNIGGCQGWTAVGWLPAWLPKLPWLPKFAPPPPGFGFFQCHCAHPSRGPPPIIWTPPHTSLDTAQERTAAQWSRWVIQMGGCGGRPLVELTQKWMECAEGWYRHCFPIDIIPELTL